MAVSVRFISAPPVPEEQSSSSAIARTILQIAPCLGETGKRLLDAGEIYQLFLSLLTGGIPVLPFHGTTVITGPGNVTLVSGESFASIRQVTPAAINITLPPHPVTGTAVVVKDSLGVCFAHNFTINTSDGSLIDLLPTYVFINAFQGQMFIFDGVGWGVVS